MERSEQRILTTHVGSLPRPPALRDLLVRQDRGERVDEAALARETEAAVRWAVDRQLAVGIDVGNDGEQPRAGFSTYVARRMRGFGGESQRRLARDLTDHPDYAELLASRRRGAARIGNAPQAVAEVEYADLREAEAECRLFLAATAAHPRRFAERFMTAVSPGTAATILLNAHYDSHERYVRALARELRKEYRLVHAQGLVLQLDCPDLAMERARFFQDEPLERFQAMVALHVDAINEAIEGIPKDRVRLHVCWGNYDGPHTHDVPLEAVLPLLYRARRGRALPAAGRAAPPARVPGPRAPSPARRHAVPARRDRHDDQRRGAPGGRGGADRPGGRGGRRPQPRHRVDGLRLRDLRGLGERGRERRVGQARRARRGRRPCLGAGCGGAGRGG